MPERKFCTVRFNLDKPEQRKAWAYLQNLNRLEFKSYSAVIIAALNKFFDETDFDFADILAKRIVKEIQNSSIELKSDGSVTMAANEESIAWDFLDESINNIEE